MKTTKRDRLLAAYEQRLKRTLEKSRRQIRRTNWRVADLSQSAKGLERRVKDRRSPAEDRVWRWILKVNSDGTIQRLRHWFKILRVQGRRILEDAALAAARNLKPSFQKYKEGSDSCPDQFLKNRVPSSRSYTMIAPNPSALKDELRTRFIQHSFSAIGME